MLRAFVFLLVTLTTLSAADVTTLTGKKYTGSVTAVTEGNVTIRTDAGPITIPVKEMAMVDFGTKPIEHDKLKHDELELTDGSLLRVSGVKIAGRKVDPAALPIAPIAGAAAPAFTVPLDSVFSWMRNANETVNREDWKKLLANRGKRDLFVIRDGDKLSPVPGTILNGNDEGDGIDFERETDNQKVKYKLVRATGGLVFNQPPRGVIPPTLCKLIDRFGNVLVVQSLTVAGEALEVKTVSGATLKYASSEAIAKLDFSTGNVIYLSDREPTVSAPPAPTVIGDPELKVIKDNSSEGAGFKLRDAIYTRGLQVPPGFALTYKLNSEFREFKTVTGIDDRLQELSLAIRLIVEADSKVVFNEVIKRTDKPRELTLDVKNVKSLTIRVESESPNARAQIALADARFQK